MSDNVALTADGSKKSASDEVTYSNDLAHVQLARIVHVIGAEGSKTVVELVRQDETTFALATDAVLPVAGLYLTTPDAVANGKIGVLAMTPYRAVHVHMVNADGTSISSGTSTTTDSMSVKIATDKIMDNLTELTPKFAMIAASSAGDNQLVAGVTSKKIRVLAYNFIASGEVAAKFRSNTTDKSGLKIAGGKGYGICAPFNPIGWLETAAGEALNLNLSGAMYVGGELNYVEV